MTADRDFIILDHGLFCDLATALGRDPKTRSVKYFMPWASGFSQRNQLNVGEGLEGVERVREWEPYLDDENLCWVFPDILFAGRVNMIRKMGRRVWGSGDGEELELHRLKSKKYMQKLGLDIGQYDVVKGIGDLREYVKKHPNVWVKSPETRGDFESFFAQNYHLVEPVLDKIEYQLGVDADDAEFVVEANIPDATELAVDTYSIDGVFPSKSCVGIEVKAKGYLSHFLPDTQWPKQHRVINDKLSHALKQSHYRNFYAVETRITGDGKAWVLDPAMRFGSPPSELLQIMYSNIADIIWEGGEGKCIDPVPSGKWGAELIIYSSWAEDSFQPVEFPKELRPNISLRFASKMKGRYAVRPQPAKLSHVGSVSAVGPTMEEAVKKCREYAEQVHGHGIEVYGESLDGPMDQWKKIGSGGVRI